MEQSNAYKKGFIPYALAAFLIGIVGGFSTVLGPSFVQDIGIAYNNTTWTALAQAMSPPALLFWERWEMLSGARPHFLLGSLCLHWEMFCRHCQTPLYL